MKEKVKRAGILTFVFLIAVIVFSFLTNQGNADMTAGYGGSDTAEDTDCIGRI